MHRAECPERGSRPVLAGSPSPLMGPAHHHVDPRAAAEAAHKPRGPIRHGSFSTLRAVGNNEVNYFITMAGHSGLEPETDSKLCAIMNDLPPMSPFHRGGK